MKHRLPTTSDDENMDFVDLCEPAAIIKELFFSIRQITLNKHL